jgi:hypothetical protein
VDVLVGIDGSRESAAASTAALELLGDRVGRLTLVAVTEVDDSVAGHQERARLREELERQAEAVRAWLRERDVPAQAQKKVVPELQLMSGPPARTLDTIAAEDGYGLLVDRAGRVGNGQPVEALWRLRAGDGPRATHGPRVLRGSGGIVAGGVSPLAVGRAEVLPAAKGSETTS